MGASYLRSMLERDSYEQKCLRVIRNMQRIQQTIPFDGIAFSGLSGTLLAPVVALSLRLAMIPVRRRSDDSHSARPIEWEVYPARIIILDDLVETGNTVKWICKNCQDIAGATIVGLALHRRLDRDREPVDFKAPLQKYDDWMDYEGIRYEETSFRFPLWFV